MDVSHLVDVKPSADLDPFDSGDTVRVSAKVVEGEPHREGIELLLELGDDLGLGENALVDLDDQIEIRTDSAQLPQGFQKLRPSQLGGVRVEEEERHFRARVGQDFDRPAAKETTQLRLAIQGLRDPEELLRGRRELGVGAASQYLVGLDRSAGKWSLKPTSTNVTGGRRPAVCSARSRAECDV